MAGISLVGRACGRIFNYCIFVSNCSVQIFYPLHTDTSDHSREDSTSSAAALTAPPTSRSPSPEEQAEKQQVLVEKFQQLSTSASGILFIL